MQYTIYTIYFIIYILYTIYIIYLLHTIYIKYNILSIEHILRFAGDPQYILERADCIMISPLISLNYHICIVYDLYIYH